MGERTVDVQQVVVLPLALGPFTFSISFSFSIFHHLLLDLVFFGLSLSLSLSLGSLPQCVSALKCISGLPTRPPVDRLGRLALCSSGCSPAWPCTFSTWSYSLVSASGLSSFRLWLVSVGLFRLHSGCQATPPFRPVRRFARAVQWTALFLVATTKFRVHSIGFWCIANSQQQQQEQQPHPVSTRRPSVRTWRNNWHVVVNSSRFTISFATVSCSPPEIRLERNKGEPVSLLAPRGWCKNRVQVTATDAGDRKPRRRASQSHDPPARPVGPQVPHFLRDVIDSRHHVALRLWPAVESQSNIRGDRRSPAHQR